MRAGVNTRVGGEMKATAASTETWLYFSTSLKYKIPCQLL